jgi:hypothetical protein
MLLSLKSKAASNFGLLRQRPGYYSAFTFFTGTMGYIFYYGPEIESKISRYALAGTASIIFVELFTHSVDTINMNSKIVKDGGAKLDIRHLYKTQGLSPFFKGISCVLYGYFFSSYVYFVAYAHIKNHLKHSNLDGQKTVVIDQKDVITP